MVVVGSGGEGTLLLGGGGGRGVPFGGRSGYDNGSGEEPSGNFGVEGALLLLIWRTFQCHRAERDQSTHWSSRNKCGGGDGEKDSEAHSEVVS